MDVVERLVDDDFRAFLAEVTEAFDKGSDPPELRAKSIDVVVERTPPEGDESRGGG